MTLAEFRQEMAARQAAHDAFRAEIERVFAATGRFVMPTTQPGKTWALTKNIGAAPLRITFFDGKEPTGHIEVRSFDEAARELIGWRASARQRGQNDTPAV